MSIPALHGLTLTDFFQTLVIVSDMCPKSVDKLCQANHRSWGFKIVSAKIYVVCAGTLDELTEPSHNFWSHRAGALVQWLKLLSWKVGDRGSEPHSGFQILEKQNVSSHIRHHIHYATIILTCITVKVSLSNIKPTLVQRIVFTGCLCGEHL